MSRPLLAVVCALVSATLTAQTTHYVSPSGTGDGTSWSKAADLQDALKRARSGDAIWLSAGTYPTSSTGNRESSFLLPSDVTMLAGFSGSETSASARDPRKHIAILTGEIGSPERTDNAFTILRITDASPRTIIDGITFQDAHANGSGPVADPRRAGGAVLISISGIGASCAPTFTNCTFERNFARDGGAVYVNGSAGRATPSFVGCAFRQNEADLDGGAIYNDGRRSGEASPTFVECTFEANEANYGAAVFNQATKGSANPRLTNCRFADNKAYVRGTTLYSIDHQGTSRPILLACTFDEQALETGAADDLARGN